MVDIIQAVFDTNFLAIYLNFIKCCEALERNSCWHSPHWLQVHKLELLMLPKVSYRNALLIFLGVTSLIGSIYWLLLGYSLLKSAIQTFSGLS